VGEPIGYVDVPFHAGMYADDRVNIWLAQKINFLHMILLDGVFVKKMSFRVLDHSVMSHFYRSVELQSKKHISPIDYFSAVNSLFCMKSKTLYKKGVFSS
jgi:hypothetical protein